MKMVNDNVEKMVRIPGNLLDKLAGQEKALGLPENLYMLPELGDQNGDKDAVEVLDHSEKDPNPGKRKWGPILIEKRPCRKPQDGRTIMEKAQDRKRRTNLDGVKGDSKAYNSFAPLSCDEIVSVADEIGVKLGND
jgi:hypothetical protein